MTTSTLQHRQLDLFAAPPVTKRKAPITAAKLVAISLGLYRASRPITAGTPAALFLRLHHLPNDGEARWHPSLKNGETRGPGVILLARGLRTGDICGCVRLFLDELGWVTARKPLGRVYYGATLNRPDRPP